MLYVVDAPTVVSVAFLGGSANAAFLGMTELLNGGSLCFPNEVVTELERTARDEPPLVWAQACEANRCNKGAAYNYAEWVGHDFDAIVDRTVRDTQESAALYVVAQALELRDAGEDVTVVTEDLRPKPTRASVRQACEHFGIRCLTLEDFLSETGLD